ncbi:PfkB family carbohydrate kinase [Nocardia sp. NPDC057353]|uniref:PfkB family carbohydrate kinase n=1 Tax=Nocardia sp. NPDC057353 TaxID=3346104 RepID=UPI00362D22FC
MSGPVVVVGDILLDIDVDGRADRRAPDAPVPVVDVVSRSYRAGGAGLAALLAARDVGEVLLLGGIGADEGGARLLALLSGAVQVLPLPLRGGTACKERVRATGPWADGRGRGGAAPVPITRLDHGDGRVPGSPLTAEARAALRGAGAVLVADYGRGVAAHPEIRSLLASLTGRIPIVWDPHPRGPAPVAGVTLATPNRAEAAARTGAAQPTAMATELLRLWAARAVAVTLGPEGALLGDAAGTHPVPLPAADRAAAGADTCGAGDRFAAATTVALASGADPAAAVRHAVAAAAEFVRAGAATTVGTTVRAAAESAAG